MKNGKEKKRRARSKPIKGQRRIEEQSKLNILKK